MIKIQEMKNKFLKLKPFQETLGMSYCGPVSLKIVLDYYGIETSEKELACVFGCLHNRF